MNVREMFYKMSSGSCHVLYDIVMTFSQHRKTRAVAGQHSSPVSCIV